MSIDQQKNEYQHGRNHTHLFLFLILITITLSALSAQAAPQTATESELPLCRYGIAASEYERDVISQVNAGWYLKFNYPVWYGPLPNNGAERAIMIKTFQAKTAQGDYLPDYTTSMPLEKELAGYIRSNPGAIWIIGNEVDRGPQPGETEGGQGDMYPEIYAIAYHEVSAFIKANDPTARVAISGLVEVTPGRMQYLDRVWNAYIARYGRPMKVDIWNMHLYALPEVQADGITPNGTANIALGTDPTLGKRDSAGFADRCPDHDTYCKAEHDDMDIFAEQVIMMREWMKAHGQQQKPLMLSEFSILYSYAGADRPLSVRDEYGNYFTPARVSAFMRNAFDYLNQAQDEELGYALDDNRLVQQWLWFAAYSRWGSSSDLVEDDIKTLTMMGETFRDYVAAEQPTLNLVVGPIPRSVATIERDGTGTAVLQIPIHNAGSTALHDTFRVTIYADAALTRVIDSVQVSPQIKGCAMQTIDVRGQWAGLVPGTHTYWVKIDSDNTIPEQPAHDADNIAQGTVLVTTNGLLIPLTASN